MLFDDGVCYDGIGIDSDNMMVVVFVIISVFDDGAGCDGDRE